LGYNLIRYAEIEIGGQLIDRLYGEWLYLWDALTSNTSQSMKTWQMVGDGLAPGSQSLSPPVGCGLNTNSSRPGIPTVLYIPLYFFFTKNPGAALPLIALQYHEVKINLDIRPIDECLWAVSSLNSLTDGNTKVTQAYNQSLVAASLYVDYVFLDTDERRRMAQNPHEYLIEQLQFTGDESVGSSSNKIKLNFNHPCKELIWVVQPDENVDYCSSLTSGSLLYKTLGAQPFNYTDAVDALPNAIHAFGSSDSVVGSGNGYGFIDASGIFQSAGAADVTESGWWNSPSPDVSYNVPQLGFDGIQNSGVSDAGTFVLTETSLDLHCWGENPVVTAKLQLNGQDRFSEREGTYFDLVQPYQHHTRNPDTGINVYSFALRPEEHQPSGSCNFSRIDNATLQLVLSNSTVEGTKTAKVRVYATNYNVLRVMSGIRLACAQQLAAILDICFLVWINSVKQIYIQQYQNVLYNQLVSV